MSSKYGGTENKHTYKEGGQHTRNSPCNISKSPIRVLSSSVEPCFPYQCFKHTERYVSDNEATHLQ